MLKKEFDQSFIGSMKADGWIKTDSGKTRQLDYNDKFALFVKKAQISEILKNSAKSVSKSPCISTKVGPPLKPVMEIYKVNESLGAYTAGGSLKPSYRCEFLDLLPLASSSLCISCSCLYSVSPNKTFCYSFGFIKDDHLYSFLFFPFRDVAPLLTLDIMLARILDYVGTERYDRRKYSTYRYIANLDDAGNPVVLTCDKYGDAKSAGIYGFNTSDNDKPTSVLLSDLKGSDKNSYKGVLTDFHIKDVPVTHVTLVTSHGVQFISSLEKDSAYSLNLLSDSNLRSLVKMDSGCTFTSKPISFNCNSVTSGGWYFTRSISMDIRDVVYHCFDKDFSTTDIGKAAGVKQLDPNESRECITYEANLDQLALEEPALFASYASLRTANVLVYMSKIWGVNNSIPTTLNKRSTEISKNTLMKIYGYNSDAEYYAGYSGTYLAKGKLKQTCKGKFCRNGSYMPLNADCNEIQRLAASSYRGGYNGCFSVDCHNSHTTYDLDIASAYPTAMNLVPQIDWNNPIERRFEEGHILTAEDFTIDGVENPMTPIFVSATFEFPDNVKFPCLNRCKENDVYAPMYPLEETSPVYYCGPELYLAVKLGAKVCIHAGCKARIKHDEFGSIIYPFSPLVHGLVKARTTAEKQHGKCMESKILKFAVNSLYGKTGQGVQNLYLPENEKDFSESPLSNPVVASMTTSFVRAVLFAALNSITDAGFHVYSATTDGLITDIDPDKLKKMDLYGFNDMLKYSRHILTDETSPDTWVVKHEQTDLLNLTTRGNASMSGTGVIAMNGLPRLIKDIPKEHETNRKFFVENAVKRTGKLHYEKKIYPTLNEVSKSNPYIPKKTSSTVSLDFDMKRKPIKDSLRAEYKIIDGVEYEVAHIETEPYKNTEEYLLYQEVKSSMTCMRTVSDWKLFFSRLDLKSKGCSHLPKSDDGDYTFKILCSCIIGYKAGKWKIPYLDNKDLSVADKIKWINSFNTSKVKTYGKSQWSAASDKKKQASVLPQAVVQEMLDKMNSTPVTEIAKEEESNVPEQVSHESMQQEINDSIPGNESDTVTTCEEGPEEEEIFEELRQEKKAKEKAEINDFGRLDYVNDEGDVVPNYCDSFYDYDTNGYHDEDCDELPF